MMEHGTTAIEQLDTDVLVVGGGPAGAWAALKAADAGARVVLLDKGYCGTSGATASGGTGVWYVQPDPAAREAAMASREALGGYLADRRWMSRVLDRTYAGMAELAERGRYPFPVDENGRQIRRGVQGPEYMRRMRALVRRAGVTILDHSPLLELLTDSSGVVAGGIAQRRQDRSRLRVRAGAVVLATGGCAFSSGAFGCDVNTGDGALHAAEVGAELSGMEFSNAYGIAPAFASVTKTAYYTFATFYRPDGSVLAGAGSQRGRRVIARSLLHGPVYCRLDHATAEDQAAMRRGQPNFFLPFDRLGINPFTELFPVTLLAEGTVRGTGGLRLVDDDCATTVPGLFAAGDVATRELICGGFTGGGSHNAAWALSSGSWAGAAAARHARSLGSLAASRVLEPAGTSGLRPADAPRAGFVADAALRAAVQEQVLPYDRNFLRHADRLTPSLRALDDVWATARALLRPPEQELWRGREVAAMAAVARWMYTSALARTESRGMHKREDFPEQDPSQHHRLTVGGLDVLWTRVEPLDIELPIGVLAS